jgi:hypothetical protein
MKPANQMPEDEIEKLFEWFYAWRNRGITPLVSIKGYSELLLKGAAGDLTEEQRQFIQIIHRNCLRAVEQWHLVLDHLGFYYDRQHPRWEETHLSDVINQALANPPENIDISNINIELADDLPSIRGDDGLSAAIHYLIVPNLDYSHSKNDPITIKASLIEKSTVQVQIYNGIQLSSEYIEQPQPLFFPGTRLSVAKQIIEQFDSQLQVHPFSKGIEFRFNLPVWQMPAGTPLVVELTSKSNGSKIDLIQGQDLVIYLAEKISICSWDIIDVNSRVLFQAGSSWSQQKESLKLHFRTGNIGQTPLRIEYKRDESSAAETFAIEITVKPQG